ncbi:hypothetical protein QYE76_046896 [Lolium multiflorum]|uniref:F-box domain-containing protein n=1 Tax=Lolium multiflorum TaxID=4521 RepID=A0AAD8TQU9_LOLMU|nr:hypothetical protein QYE76_046896 [Lolium multiflorum]
MGHSRPRWKNAQRKSGQEDKGDAIPDELLGLVFLRLTSPLDLVRAAFACRSWRKVIAAEDFRVLSARHGAPSSIVAGHYHISFSHCHYRPSGLLPHFVPSSSSCWAGVAANNLALDFLPRAPNGDLSLELADSRGGLLLLADFDHTEHGKPFEQPSRLVVCDPLAAQAGRPAQARRCPGPGAQHSLRLASVADDLRLGGSASHHATNDATRRAPNPNSAGGAHTSGRPAHFDSKPPRLRRILPSPSSPVSTISRASGLLE